MSPYRRLKFLSGVLIPLFFAALPPGIAQSQDSYFQTAPLNPAFVEYLQKSIIQQTLGEATEERGYGFIPSPVDRSHMKGVRLSGDSIHQNLGYDPVYDLRSSGRLTPVRNQGMYNTCWAFATYSSMESWLLTDESAVWNFSENNMANLHGYDLGYDSGGNYDMSTAYLARWDGPVLESDDLYESGPGASLGNEPVQKHVQQVFYLPGRAGALDNDNIKQAVVQYGAVAAAMYYNDGYYNGAYSSYYYGGEASSNHGVAIVGWDDTFDKAQFNPEPVGNGAFIVRNSWGTAWGDGGYFYVSYYDARIGEYCVVFNSAETVDNYSYTYAYDHLGWVNNFGNEVAETAWFANIFTALPGHSVTAVGFYAPAASSVYEVYVYTGVTAGLPLNGTLVSAKAGTLQASGYHTVELSAPVSVSSGQMFSVAVKLTTPGYTYPVSVEYAIPLYSSAASANPGESFISINGTDWLDTTGILASMNVCLKAFAVEIPSLPPDQPENVSPAGGTAGVSITPTLTANSFSDPEAGVFSFARWRIKKDAAVIWNATNTSTSIALPSGVLDYDTEYSWQVEYVNDSGLSSGWSVETYFTTQDDPQRPPNRPVNLSPANLATGVSLLPALTASGFSDPDGDTMADSHWRMRAETGTYSTAAVWELENAGATTSVTIAQILSGGVRYFWQVRYMDSAENWSEWSEETAFTTTGEDMPDDDDADGDTDEARGGGGGGGCFIATAAYGTEMAEEVIKLKNFRDRKLMSGKAGRAFVRWYYRHSPSAANYISRRPAAKFFVRVCLRPVVWFLSFSLSLEGRG